MYNVQEHKKAHDISSRALFIIVVQPLFLLPCTAIYSARSVFKKAMVLRFSKMMTEMARGQQHSVVLHRFLFTERKNCTELGTKSSKMYNSE